MYNHSKHFNLIHQFIKGFQLKFAQEVRSLISATRHSLSNQFGPEGMLKFRQLQSRRWKQRFNGKLKHRSVVTWNVQIYEWKNQCLNEDNSAVDCDIQCKATTMEEF